MQCCSALEVSDVCINISYKVSCLYDVLSNSENRIL